MRIEDYAVIGDCHTGALMGLDGSIDWLYMPRFDSEHAPLRLRCLFRSAFGTAQAWPIAARTGRHGKKAHGRARNQALPRRQLDPGNLFTTSTGSVKLIEFIVLGTEDRLLVRIVEGVIGRLTMLHTSLWLDQDGRQSPASAAGRFSAGQRSAHPPHRIRDQEEAAAQRPGPAL